MKFIIKNGCLNIVYKNKIILSNLSFKLDYQDGEYKFSSNFTVIDDLTASSDDVLLCLKKEAKGFKFNVSLTNIHENLKKVNIVELMCTYNNYIKKCLKNHYVIANNNIANEMQSTLEIVSMSNGKTIDSVDNVSFIDDKNNNVIFGLITYKKYFNKLNISHDGTINVQFFNEHHDFNKGECIQSDWLYMGFFKDIAYDGLISFASIIAKNMNVAKINKKAPVGYCTWYYYYSNIDSNSVYENYKFIHDNTKFPIKYIQIDDGWQKNWCNWEENDKFINLKELISDINKKGFKAGLWFAPFSCNDEGWILLNHPDWLVKNIDDDNPYKNYSIDFSHPEVEKYFTQLFLKYSKQYNIKYFKLDIITPSLAPARYYDPHFNSVSNLAKGLSIIKNAIGEDGEVLACTCPLSYAAGLCDYMRVSGDVFGGWDSLIYIFNSTLKRYYFNNNLFINDADCLIIRNKENEDDMCKLKVTRNDDEVKTYISLLSSTGGTIMLSDKLSLLNKKQLSMIDYLFPNVNVSSIPMDIMDSQLISYLDGTTINGIRTMYLINWENKEKEFTLNIENVHVYDFWNNKYEGIFNKQYKCIVKPHCCKVLHVSVLKDIQVIGSSSVIRPSIKCKRKDDKIMISNIKLNEKQLIYSKYELLKQEGLIKIGKNIYQFCNNDGKNEYILTIKNK